MKYHYTQLKCQSLDSFFSYSKILAFYYFILEKVNVTKKYELDLNLEMADKIVKAFEALRSHYLQESTQAVNLAQKNAAGVVEGAEAGSSSPNPK